MPVIVPLPSRRARRAVAHAFAITAVVGASVTALTAADRHGGTPAPGLAALQQPMAPAPAAAAPMAAPVAAPEPPPEIWPTTKAAKEMRPLTVRPVAGALSSLFGTRWGTLHGGIDFAQTLGTPIASVTDGEVVEAGPASGFGQWVRVRQDDGTIGVYGHVNDILVVPGQQVRAGDTIATVGNGGFSTGPHLHYEVWAQENGDKIDPLPWLAARGIDLGDVSY
ncbi:M23 family metallopeptidase [Nocardia sp. BMG51109]|uniref:M23 family metallopeptidase n=1 Tax=Nocardia sp. BMG51109 TaxID=1056816 RepID=UPI0004B46B90|nr:M23 family metallopeptidase [Nocardia sp. BMG51109]